MIAQVVAAVVVGGAITAAAVIIWPARPGRDTVPPVPARAMRRLLDTEDTTPSAPDGTR